MKSSLLFRIAFLSLFFLTSVAFSQVTNGNYNMEVHFLQHNGLIALDPFDSGEQTVLATARNNTDGLRKELFSKNSGAANTPNICYTYSVSATSPNYWGDAVDVNMGTIINSASGVYDFEVFSWEDDVGNRCTWDNFDEGPVATWGLVNPRINPPVSWTEINPQISYANGNRIFRMKHTWRFTNGERTSPLNFGNVGTDTFIHINTSRGVPLNANTALGYKNQWSSFGAFQSSNDVTYTFNITTASRIIFSTAFPETDFDTYLHLVRLNTDGTFNSYVAGDDDSGGSRKSLLQRDLCPGLYGVIVEGYSSNTGDFKLSLTSSTVPPVFAGEIAISTNNGSFLQLCPNATIPQINSTSSAISTVGNVTYKWQRRTLNSDGVPTPWADYPAAGTGASASDLGTMGDNQNVYFKRIATDCSGSRETWQMNFARRNTSVNGGTIGINNTTANAIMIPTPQEVTTTITSSVNGTGAAGTVISWEKNESSGGWVAVAGSGQSFTLPNSLNTPTQFRRKTTSTCPDPEVSAYSNTVTINVVTPNGQIKGRVVSKTNAGVSGVTITAVRTSSPPSGGVVNKTYTTITGIDGFYDFSNQGIYYGDPTNGSGASANFQITPSKNNNGYNPGSITRTMNQLAPVVENVNFTDTTAFSITGIVTQECATCTGGTTNNPIICNSKDVEFLIDNVFRGNKTLTDGTYALSVDEQRNYIIKPRYKNHKFDPNQVVLSVGEESFIENVNFKDTTTFTISGKVLAGCEEYIGKATLRFTQVLPPINNNPVSGCLVKEITTNELTGYYSIRLPAGKYRASVVSFNSNDSNLNGLTVTDFLNNNVLVQDSLIRDIDTTNRVLNLVYPRPPVLEVIGLNTACTPTTNICGSGTVTPPYSLMSQNDSTTFTVKVWQGSTKTCPAKDSLVYLSTNIQQDDTNEDFIFANDTGSIEIKLKGGLPNIVCPYFKTFNLRYTDKFGRPATSINKNVVVTGLKGDIGTFTTVTPELPLRILHDPPGDNSSSFWEANTTSESAIRMFRSDGGSGTLWHEVKIGAEVETGIGLVFENSVWGKVKGTLTVGGRNTTSNEAIVSVNTSQRYSTADNPLVVGAQGDVFIGSAFNLLYSKVYTISDSSCNLIKETDFIIAPNGFATDYVYSERHIIDTILPTLRAFRDNPSNTPPEKEKYRDQVSVWEQVISNNVRNKKNAQFEKNISFDGASGAISSTTTATATNSNTIEFGVEVDTQLALELGFEVAGTGASGGAIVNYKMETGGGTTTTNVNSTTTGYVLDDKDNGDYFSIDIKKDPVYSTPVFELVAGTSSCPWEDGTQPRDDMQLVCAAPTQTVTNPAGEAEFILQLSNISQSGETRIYALSFDQSSNPDGAVVTIGGSPVVGSTLYTIASGTSVQVTVKVRKGASSVFSFTGLRFILADNCGGFIRKSVSLNAYFNSPCSTISLATPTNGFRINSNIVSTILKDYTVANLTNVTLEYSKVGTSSWSSGFTRTAAQLSTDPSGTQVNWDISTLTDGEYNFRLKLLCGSNVIYAPTISGLIDRAAPTLFGSPEPTDDNYVIGDQISATYNEILGCANLNNTNLNVRNLKTNAAISAQLGCFENKIMIVPLSSMGVLGDSVRVTLSNISDIAGNVKTTADSWLFILGNSMASTGNNTVTLNSASGVVTSNAAISMIENATGTLDFFFNLPANAPNDYLINYSISGSANASNDYTVSFFPSNFVDGRKINSNRFDGTSGTITILRGQKTARLSIDPAGDAIFEGNETIIISLNEGGDYGIGAINTMTGTILNDDADDCLNGGNVFMLINNNPGGTAIVQDTYHKSLLQTNGTIETPSNVTMKGAKSVTMTPGFQVKAGSIFTASIEGCPQAPAAFSVANPKNDGKTSNNFILASNNEGFITSVAEPVTDIKFEPSMFAATSEDRVFFEFKLEKDEKITLVLLNDFAGEKVRIIDAEDYKAGVYNVKIETSTLQKGNYYLQLITSDKKTFQKISIK